MGQVNESLYLVPVGLGVQQLRLDWTIARTSLLQHLHDMSELRQPDVLAAQTADERANDGRSILLSQQ